MYSNDQTQIRAGLINYIGAMLQASKYDNEKAVKHSVVAILLEETAKLCKDIDGEFDMFISKPVLRLTSGITKQRQSLLSVLPQTQEVSETLKAYKLVQTELDNILKNTKA